VAQLAARPADPQVQAAIDHQPATHACADGEDRDGVDATSGPEFPLAERDRPRVVQDVDGQV
jgi:hypothetical protein